MTLFCVPVGAVGWADPPGGPDCHGRSHSEPVFCRRGGYRELFDIDLIRFVFVSAGPLLGLHMPI